MTDQERLTEARQALHDLVTGVLPHTVIDQNGEQIRYNYTNRRGLEAYITELEAKVNTRVTGPMRVCF